jgi:AraC-like DNA-binding protein
MPGPRVVMILELGNPIRVHDPADERHAVAFGGGFVAGLDDRSTLTSHDGAQRGIQIDLTPCAARRLFGLPLSELAGQVIPLIDLLPRTERHLAERLANLTSWDARLDVVERLLLERITGSPLDTRLATWAVRRIEASGGCLNSRTLARELGYSQKHVIALFHDHVGMTPARFGRLVRFDRLVGHLRQGGSGSWAELAARFGWFDQAHLTNDVKRIVGEPPSRARAALAGPKALTALQNAPGDAA